MLNRLLTSTTKLTIKEPKIHCVDKYEIKKAKRRAFIYKDRIF